MTRDIDFRGNGDEQTVITGFSGAFRVEGARARFYDLAIVNSVAPSGAAIYAEDADVFVFDSRFERNRATGADLGMGGGAIWGAGGTVYVQDSEFTRNFATAGAGSGGAILAGEGASLRVIGSAFTSNLALRAGGAIEDVSGTGFVSEVVDATLHLQPRRPHRHPVGARQRRRHPRHGCR